MEDLLLGLNFRVTLLMAYYIIYRLYRRRFVDIKACIVTEGKRVRSPKRYSRTVYGVCYSINGMKYHCYVLKIGNEKYRKGQIITLTVNKYDHYAIQAPVPMVSVVIQSIALLLCWILMLVLLLVYYL